VNLALEVAAARRRPAGLTEAVSESLRQMLHQSLSANEVREWLEKEGFDLLEYSQHLATISVTLGRLASWRVKPGSLLRFWNKPRVRSRTEDPMIAAPCC
jgi:hypothetical protein